jgi:hypothetical protein
MSHLISQAAENSRERGFLVRAIFMGTPQEKRLSMRLAVV